MNSIPEHPIFEYDEDILTDIRKKYNLDKPGDMDKAIDILQFWLMKQEHLKKKDFSREYLERLIISMKGSVERAKTRIDKLCTIRTLLPRMFQYCDMKEDFKKLREVLIQALLPKLTHDHKRVYVAQTNCISYSTEYHLAGYQSIIMYFDHCTHYDYNDGYITIYDIRKMNVVDLMGAVNLIDIRDIYTVTVKGYALKVKGIHIISESKAVDLLNSFLKQFLSKKLLERIHFHKTVESLYDYVPKEILPVDYGGNEKHFAELCDDWVNMLSEEKNVKHFKEMKEAGTNESLRKVDKFNDEYMGMPGTFRTLTVD